MYCRWTVNVNRDTLQLSAEGPCMLEDLNCGSAYLIAKAGGPKSF